MAKEARSSLWDRLMEATRTSIGWTVPPQEPSPAGDAEAVRGAMRSVLLEASSSRRAVRLACAIDRSPDLRALWYLRAPLMQAIAQERGERNARQAVAALDPLFRQAWPGAPVSRRSILG